MCENAFCIQTSRLRTKLLILYLINERKIFPKFIFIYVHGHETLRPALWWGPPANDDNTIWEFDQALITGKSSILVRQRHLAEDRHRHQHEKWPAPRASPQHRTVSARGAPTTTALPSRDILGTSFVARENSTYIPLSDTVLHTSRRWLSGRH